MLEIIAKDECRWNEVDGTSTHKILVYGTDFALKRLGRLIENKVSLLPHFKHYLSKAKVCIFLI